MGGDDRRGERAGPGQHLRLHGAVRAAAAPPGAGRRPAVGRDSTRRRRRPASSAPLRILVAEDSEFNSRHLERLLGRRGHAVRVATDGREGCWIWSGSRAGLSTSCSWTSTCRSSTASRSSGRSGSGSGPRGTSARHRLDGALAAGGPRALPRGRHGRLPLEAGPGRGTVRGHRPGGLRPGVPGRPGRRPGTARACSTRSPCWPPAATTRRVCASCARISGPIAPARLAEVCDALRARDAPRLREAAHKLCGLLSAFSTAAGDVASDLEDHAARGQLDEARPLVERLETMARELIARWRACRSRPCVSRARRR